MKDRILNILMLLAVAMALAATLIRGGEESPPELLPMNAAQPIAPTDAPEPVAAFKAERREIRTQEQAALLSLISAPDTDAQVRLLAEAQLAALAKNDEIELAAEAALLGRGYDPALCVAREGEAVLFVSGEIDARDAALILEIVANASGLPLENIRVSGYAF